MSKLCRKNNPLLVSLGVFGVLEAIILIQNPQNMYFATLMGMPITLGAAGATYVAIKVVACR